MKLYKLYKDTIYLKADEWEEVKNSPEKALLLMYFARKNNVNTLLVHFNEITKDMTIEFSNLMYSSKFRIPLEKPTPKKKPRRKLVLK